MRIYVFRKCACCKTYAFATLRKCGNLCPMKTIVIAAQKGGAGNHPSARKLAVCRLHMLAPSVLCLDSGPQGCLEERGGKFGIRRAFDCMDRNPRRRCSQGHPERRPRLQFDLCIIDTRRRTRMADRGAGVADLVLIPVRPFARRSCGSSVATIAEP